MLLPLHHEFMYIYFTDFWPPGPLDQSQKVNLDEKHKFVISPTKIKHTNPSILFHPKILMIPIFFGHKSASPFTFSQQKYPTCTWKVQIYLSHCRRSRTVERWKSRPNQHLANKSTSANPTNGCSISNYQPTSMQLIVFSYLICVISIITREFTVSFGIFPPYLTTKNAHDYQDYTCSFLGFPLLLAVRLDLKVEINIKNHVSAAPQTCKTSCLASAYSCAVGNSDLSTTSWWNNTTCFDHATVETILHQLLCQKSVL